MSTFIPPKSRIPWDAGAVKIGHKEAAFPGGWPAPSFTAGSSLSLSPSAAFPLTGLCPGGPRTQRKSSRESGFPSPGPRARRTKGQARCVFFLLTPPQTHPVPADTLSSRLPRLCFVCFHTCHPGRFPIVFSNLLFERKGTAPNGVIKTLVSAGKTQFLLKPEN